MTHDQDAVANTHQVRHDMTAHQDAAAGMMPSSEQFKCIFPANCIQSAHRFIQNQPFRVAGKREGYGRALTHALGVAADFAVPCLRIQARFFKKRFGIIFIGSAKTQCMPDEVDGANTFGQLRDFGQETDQAMRPLNMTLCRMNQPQKALDQRAFAGAVDPQQPGNVALLDAEVDMPDSPVLAILLSKIFSLPWQHIRIHSLCWPCHKKRAAAAALF